MKYRLTPQPQDNVTAPSLAGVSVALRICPSVLVPDLTGNEKGACYRPPTIDTDNPLVLFRLCYMTRLFPICTDIVTPPILMVVFIILALIDRFTTKRTNAIRLPNHHPSLS